MLNAAAARGTSKYGPEAARQSAYRHYGARQLIKSKFYVGAPGNLGMATDTGSAFSAGQSD